MQAILFPPKPIQTEGSRLRSYLSLPFTTKIKSTPDFCVEADDPHKRYSAGDTVTGTVAVKVAKPVRVTHIVISLHGYVRVYKTPGVPPVDSRLRGPFKGGQTHRTGTYHGNGQATLFEEESVICGDGRLEAGRYKFRFNINFPDVPMPTSIDFERGTISYILTATMTRPTTISPVTYHDQKILYQERIDTSRYLPPKPRTITLEPLMKASGSRASRTGNDHGSIRTARAADSCPTTPLAELTPSLQSSPVAATTTTSLPMTTTATQSPGNRPGSLYERSLTSPSVTSRHGDSCEPHKAITATVASLKGGCLRGEELPINISIKHNKHVKSMHGVFLTIYRMARVDAQPALAIGPMDGKAKREHYYPISMTGLGGLSLSGAGSSHVFRKDLAQVVLPLIIDPQTLTAEMTPKIRMPDDAFPTIANVPGSMISFKYYVEVIVDIQGKVAGQDRTSHAMSVSLTDGHHKEMMIESGDRHRAQSHSILDTAWLRREKSVVVCTLEVIVGTYDEERRRIVAGKAPVTLNNGGLARAASQRSVQGSSEEVRRASPGIHRNSPSERFDESTELELTDVPEGYWTEHDDQYMPPAEGYDEDDEYMALAEGYDEGLTEKQRLERAEAALLPSRPPGEDEEEAAYELYASAPPGLDEDYEYHDPHDTGNAPDASHDDGTSVLPEYAPTHDGQDR